MTEQPAPVHVVHDESVGQLYVLLPHSWWSNNEQLGGFCRRGLAGGADQCGASVGDGAPVAGIESEAGRGRRGAERENVKAGT